MKVIETLKNYRRVLAICKKPGREDFFKTSRICAIGIVIMGLIGFAMYLLSVLFLG